MPRPQLLYPTERRIYHPELAACPHCVSPARLLNYLVSDKWIQTLTGVLSIAARPSHCPDSACPGFALRLRSVAARHLALPGCTYGLAVVAGTRAGLEPKRTPATTDYRKRQDWSLKLLIFLRYYSTKIERRGGRQ